MQKTGIRLTALSSLGSVLAGCRIDLIAPEGATIRSESGAIECVGPATCTVEVNDLFFDETFIVETDPDVFFAGWRRRDRGFCGGQADPCRLFTSGFTGNDVLLGFLESDETFFLEAELATSVADLTPVRDASIFEDQQQSSISVGRVFVGRTNNGSIRRGLVAFDLSEIPADATVASVTLTMSVDRNQQNGVAIDLHRLEADWGEGSASSSSGRPSAATDGDPTWIHRFFSTELWATPGGDFVEAASATANAASTISWSSEGMRDDVQGWVDNPESNFGWIMIGDEGLAQSVQAFVSREATNSSDVPRLTVVFSE